MFNLNSDDSKLKLNANNANPSNKWNSDNQFVFLATLFVSLLKFRGVLFCNLPAPSSEHLSNLFNLHGECNILLRIN